MRARLALVAVLSVGLSGCGYHVSGHADTMPKTVHTIALPAWGNITARYKLTERLPGALGREFLSRTRYRITAKPEEADAVLTGSVVNYLAFPSISDPQSNRATAIQISVYVQVTLTDRASGKVIYTRPNMEFKQRYEISVDQATYFDESDVAVERLSRDLARTVVSAVLEAF